MKKNLNLDSEEEPSPINYESVISGAHKKEHTNRTQEMEDDKLGSIDIEKRKIYTEQISKRKLQEEGFEELRDNNLNIESILGKYNKKSNSSVKIPKGIALENIDYYDTNEVINADNEDENENYPKSSAACSVQSKKNLAPGNFQPNSTISVNQTSGFNNNFVNNNLNFQNSFKSTHNSAKRVNNKENFECRIFKSDKSIGVVSDTSVKPRRGDKTPKSNNSHNNSQNNNENDTQPNNFDVNMLKNNLEDLLGTPERTNDQGNMSNTNIHAPNKSLLNNVVDKLKTQNSEIYGDRNYNQYDIQQLSYELVKEYSHLRIDKDESFMRRMLFDIFKRQTKEQRMNKLIDRNKRKIDENERVKTFNRLIEDANRRLEAQEKLEGMKNRLDDNVMAAPNQKKYKFDEWEEIYEDRFLKYKNEKERKIDEKLQIKLMEEKQKEEEVVQSIKNKTKKLPQTVINQSVKRMYEEAERRKLKMEKRKKINSQDFDEEISDGEIKDFIKDKETDMLPSQFKKFGKVQKYNFQSDLSGNEKSNTDDEKETIKQMIMRQSMSKEKNHKISFNSQSKSKTKSNNSSVIVNPGDRLYQRAKIKMEKEKLKNNQPLTNTEINNKRFDKNKFNNPTQNNQNFNPTLNTTYTITGNKTPNSEFKKSICSNQKNTRYNVKDHIDRDLFGNFEDEEEELRYIPKPIENNLNLDKIKLNDYKQIKNPVSNSVQNTSYTLGNSNNINPSTNKYAYMPDFMATKLVEEILHNKLNN